MYNPTNPLAVNGVGRATKKPDWDRLWNNVQSIYDSLRSSNELPIPCFALTPHDVGGAGALERLELSTGRYIVAMPFAHDALQSATLALPFPKRWNLGTVTAQAYWLNTAGGSGSVVWQVAGVSVGDDETLDAAVGTFETSTDAALAAERIGTSPQTPDITFAGSPAVGDLTRIVLQRDGLAGGDTYGATAYLVALVLRLTAAEPNDA